MDWFLYDMDLRHEKVKGFTIHEWIKNFWHHQIYKHRIYKHQNITSALVFTTVFRIHYHFFIVLPIRLETCRFNDFLFFSKAKLAPPKNLARFRGFAPPDGVGRALSRPEVTGPQTRKFIKQSNCFSVKFAKFLREHILKNIYELMLLNKNSF